MKLLSIILLLTFSYSIPVFAKKQKQHKVKHQKSHKLEELAPPPEQMADLNLLKAIDSDYTPATRKLLGDNYLVESHQLELKNGGFAVLTLESPTKDGGDEAWHKYVIDLHTIGKGQEGLESKDLKTVSTSAAHLAYFDSIVAASEGEVLAVESRSPIDGDGYENRLSYFLIKGDGSIQDVFSVDYESSSGSGYPHKVAKVEVKPIGSSSTAMLSFRFAKTETVCDRGEDDKDTCVTDTTVKFACWNGKKFDEPRRLVCPVMNAVASSILKASKTTDYGPTNSVDGINEKAWCEGAKGSGIGEWVEYQFSGPRKLERLFIKSGYLKDAVTWGANNRLKKIRLTFSDGTKQEVDLKDVEEGQSIPIKKGSRETAVETSKVRLEILQVFKGFKYDDTCLSEIEFREAAPQKGKTP